MLIRKPPNHTYLPWPLMPIFYAVLLTLTSCQQVIDTATPPNESDVAKYSSNITIGTPIDKGGNVVADIDGARMGRGYDSIFEQWLSMCVEDVGVDTINGGNA